VYHCHTVIAAAAAVYHCHTVAAPALTATAVVYHCHTDEAAAAAAVHHCHNAAAAVYHYHTVTAASATATATSCTVVLSHLLAPLDQPLLVLLLLVTQALRDRGCHATLHQRLDVLQRQLDVHAVGDQADGLQRRDAAMAQGQGICNTVNLQMLLLLLLLLRCIVATQLRLSLLRCIIATQMLLYLRRLLPLYHCQTPAGCGEIEVVAVCCWWWRRRDRRRRPERRRRCQHS
jgi:hypothetical protein